MSTSRTTWARRSTIGIPAGSAATYSSRRKTPTRSLTFVRLAVALFAAGRRWPGGAASSPGSFGLGWRRLSLAVVPRAVVRAFGRPFRRPDGSLPDGGEWVVGGVEARESPMCLCFSGLEWLVGTAGTAPCRCSAPLRRSTGSSAAGLPWPRARLGAAETGGSSTALGPVFEADNSLCSAKAGATFAERKATLTTPERSLLPDFGIDPLPAALAARASSLVDARSGTDRKTVRQAIDFVFSNGCPSPGPQWNPAGFHSPHGAARRFLADPFPILALRRRVTTPWRKGRF